MAKFNPYQELGLERSADRAEIKAAFRKKAKNAHPDYGGSADAFDRAKLAQLVLLDPHRRKSYDETGTIDEPRLDTPEQRAMGLIANMLAQIIEGDADPLAHDLIEAMKGHLLKNRTDIEQRIAKLRRSLLRIEKLKGRFKKTGDNQIDGVLRWMTDSTNKGIAACAVDIELRTIAIAILDQYGFDYEAPAEVWRMARSATTATW